MSDDLLVRESVDLQRYSSAEQLVLGLPELVARLDQRREELAAKLARVQQMLR